MAGYNTALIIQGVKDELERNEQTTARKHDEQLAEWQRMKERVAAAKRDARSIVKQLTKHLETHPDDFAGALDITNPPRSSGRGWREDALEDALKAASETVPPAPRAKRSARERALENVIKVVESHSEQTITVADLRSLGVLQFVAVPKAEC